MSRVRSMAQAWGLQLLLSYFLVEQSFKALLYVRGKAKSPKHIRCLRCSARLRKTLRKTILREYY